MIKMLIDKCHIGDSDREVIKFFIGNLKRGHETWVTVPKGARRKMMKEIVRVHRNNQFLYGSVMGGR